MRAWPSLAVSAALLLSTATTWSQAGSDTAEPTPAPMASDEDGEDEDGEDGEDEAWSWPQTEQAVDGAEVESVLRRELATGEHEFCTGLRYGLSASEAALCDFSVAAAPRCPEFARACARLREAESPSSERPAWLVTVLRWLELMARGLFWALLALTAAGVLFAVVKLLRNRRAETGNAVVEPDGPAPSNVPSAERHAPLPFDHDADRHLARARSLAAQGDFLAAIAEIHAATVLRLDARGAITAQRGRTNGDYARELHARPELVEPFRDIARAVESVQFGARSADAALYERLLARARALLGPAVLLLLLGLGNWACQSNPTRKMAALGCGDEADGYSLLCAFVGEYGNVRRRHKQLETIDPSVGVIVVLPSDLPDTAWSTLLRWVEEGGIAVMTTPVLRIDERFGVRRRATPCGTSARLDDKPDEKAELITAGPTLESEKLSPYASCGSKLYVGRVRHGSGALIYLPSPALLSNAGLAAGDNARLLLPLLPIQRGTVELVGRWTRDSVDSPLNAMRQAGLGPWLLHLTALLLAFALYRGTPFGRRRTLPQNERRRFSEHVRALGERWAEARASRTALVAYAAWALDVLKERVPSATQSSVGDLSPELARRTGQKEVDVARTLASARLAKDTETDEGNEAQHLATMRELGRLISESGGSR